jgi:hypothetical protein
MRSILKVFLITVIIMILLGVTFFLLEDENSMFSYITLVVAGIMSIGAILLIYSKDLKNTNTDKSKSIRRLVFTWVLAGLFIIPIVLVGVKVLVNYI